MGLGLLVAVTFWPQIIVARALAWMGRGLRQPIRSAMLAGSVGKQDLGKAFGFHEALDTAGALLGPAVALLLLALGTGFRSIFWVALVPGVIAVVLFGAITRDPRRTSARPATADSSPLPSTFWRLMVPVGMFGVGNFATAFFTLRAVQMVQPELDHTAALTAAVAFYLAHNAVGAVVSFPAGWLADRVGKPTVLTAAYATFAAACAVGIFGHGFGALARHGVRDPQRDQRSGGPGLQHRGRRPVDFRQSRGDFPGGRSGVSGGRGGPEPENAHVTRPIVAIVGRPNVGKSTLFNRLLGYRKAIVDATAGLTRDRLYGVADWSGREFTVVDTAGLDLDGAKDESRAAIEAQTQIAIEQAHVILLMLDVRQGLSAVDRDIALMLRRSARRVIVVANKADSPSERHFAHELLELGFDEPHLVSAQHGLGVGDLLDAVVESLPPAEETEKDESGADRLAIMGRPNVGKSSLLNALLGDERALVSEKPGTTRDPIDTELEFDGVPVVLVDTAGIRRKSSSRDRLERYSLLRGIAAMERADMVLLVVEASAGVLAQDQHVAGYALGCATPRTGERRSRRSSSSRRLLRWLPCPRSRRRASVGWCPWRWRSWGSVA